MKLNISLLLLLATAVLFSCSSDESRDLADVWTGETAAESLSIINPIEGSVFPQDIAAPSVWFTDETGKTDSWIIKIAPEGGEEFFSPIIKENRWQIPAEIWTKLKAESTGKKISVQVMGFMLSDRKLISQGTTAFSISAESVGSPIIYRSVPLPFYHALNNLEMISWRWGNISSENQAPIILGNMPVCGNCHSFSTNGKFMGMDVDYGHDKGSYAFMDIAADMAIRPEKIFSWTDYKKDDGEKTFGLLSQVSPDGRYIISTLKDRSVFVPVEDLWYSQLFFPIKGILVVYDTQTKEMKALPGADDKAFVQSNPVWSPDGKYIYFARSPYQPMPKIEMSKEAVLPTELADMFLKDGKEFKFDLYRIPFNDGNGGTAEPLQGASANGMSNYFPKISPDMKWVVFTQSDNYMLLQPDSKLYIMPAEGGEPRLMNCNSNDMNSWHSWSPNGKWMVFSSKRFGPYTQLYLTHIDENGNDSPPVLLENLMIKDRAANIPEFLNISPEKVISIEEQFMDVDYYAELRGTKKFNAGDLKGALEEYNNAITNDPANDVLYNTRSYIHLQLGNLDAAMKDISKALELNPKYSKSYHSRAYIYMEKEMFKEALADLNKAIQLEPNYIMAYMERASAKQALGDPKGALEDYDKIISLNPELSQAYYHRALIRIENDEKIAACIDLNMALKFGMKEAQELIDKYCKN